MGQQNSTKMEEYIVTIPADGVTFELTLTTAPDPMAMVRIDGHNPTGWKFKGVQTITPQTRCFKLVRVGHCRNFGEVRQKLKAHGAIPEGQWREAFRQTYFKNDGNGPIGFPDSSWVDPDSGANFPTLAERGRVWFSFFDWVGGVYSERWRWLIASK